MTFLRWLRLGRRRSPPDDAPDREIPPDFRPLFPLQEPTGPQTGADTDRRTPTRSLAGTFWRIWSANGGEVYAAPDGRVVHRSRPRPEGATSLLMFVPERIPQTGFLFSPMASTPKLRVDSDDLVADVLSFVIATGSDGLVTLRHPCKWRFLSAAWLEADKEVDLTCNRSEASGWEMFRTEQLAPEELEARSAAAVATLARVLDEGLVGDRIGAWFRTERPEVLAALGGAVLRAMPVEALKSLARDVLDDDALRTAVLSTLPDDLWTTHVIPALVAWRSRRHPAGRLQIDRRLDFLGASFVQNQGCLSSGNLLASVARTQVESRRKLAMLATARNEGIYFLEWIAHYRALGVEHFFLYSNDNNDESDALLGALADAGVVTWISNSFEPGIDGQLKAYAHCMSCLPQSLDYRWTMIADLDEFVVLDTTRYRDLVALVEARESGGANAVSLTWLMYTIGGRIDRGGEPLIDRNRHVVGYANTEVKTLFRTRDFAFSYPHDPTPVLGTDVVHHNASGDLHHWPGRGMHPSNGRPHYEDAWIAHFYFKSMDEWIWKVSRNRGGFEINRELKVNFEQIAIQALVVDRSMELRDERALVHLPGLRAELERLLALPGVADAQARVNACFDALVGDLRRKAIEGFAERAQSGSTPVEREQAKRVVEVLSAGFSPIV